MITINPTIENMFKEHETWDHKNAFKHIIENAFSVVDVSDSDFADSDIMLAVMDQKDDDCAALFVLVDGAWQYDSDIKITSLSQVSVEAYSTLLGGQGFHKRCALKQTQVYKAHARELAKKLEELGSAEQVLDLALMAVAPCENFAVNITTGKIHKLEDSTATISVYDDKHIVLTRAFEDNKPNFELTSNSVTKFCFMSKDGYSESFYLNKAIWQAVEKENSTTVAKTDVKTASRHEEIATVTDNGWRIFALSADQVNLVELDGFRQTVINVFNPALTKEMPVIIGREFETGSREPAEGLVNVDSLSQAYYLLVDPNGEFHSCIGVLGDTELKVSVTGENEDVLGSYFMVDGRSVPSWHVAFATLDGAIDYVLDNIAPKNFSNDQ